MSDWRKDLCPESHGCGTAPVCLCARIEDMADEIERLRAALKRIADGEADGFAADPSKWPSTIAGEALGYEWRDGVRINPPDTGEQP